MAQYIIKFIVCDLHGSNHNPLYQVPHGSKPECANITGLTAWFSYKPTFGVEINIAHARREYLKAHHKDCNCQITVVEI